MAEIVGGSFFIKIRSFWLSDWLYRFLKCGNNRNKQSLERSK